MEVDRSDVAQVVAAARVVVRITSNGKTRNYVAFVTETLSLPANAETVVVLAASGPSVAKAICVAEVVKTLVPGLHQFNELSGTAQQQSQLDISLSRQPLGTAAHYGFQPAT